MTARADRMMKVQPYASGIQCSTDVN